MINEQLIRSPMGYLSLREMPTKEKLQEYYAQKYFQEESGNYAKQYSQEELEYFAHMGDIANHIYTKTTNAQPGTLLDVGAGEGFFAQYFYKNGWNVCTLDYAKSGMSLHNPSLLPTLKQGDIFDTLQELQSKKEKFDFINLSNVLEHVIDPIEILTAFQTLLTKNALLRVCVPNDYSRYQDFLLQKNYTTDTWFSPPDHLHYFTFESLKKLFLSLGYEIVVEMGDFPIELYLANPSSNYYEIRAKGKDAHTARVEVDNFLFSQGRDKYIDFYKASASIGLSRQIIMYARVLS